MSPVPWNFSKIEPVLCAGSSIVYIYFNDIDKIFQFGPYHSNHATAGTFAFRKELLKISSYDDNAELAEEKHFLKDYTIPFVQLDPRKTILVLSIRKIKSNLTINISINE